ncbi:MAG: Cof-type HAD-IIB family hydrolase [Actinobacteria bacterium]|nr:Cof-type HAD-IIB family hydrolase [Actinomycetota bacterium]
MTPRRISDEIAYRLRHLILKGEIAPGDRLPSERELGRRFEAGRPAVREALRELAAQGHVTIGRGRQGTRAATRTEDAHFRPLPGLSLHRGVDAQAAVIHLMELRMAIETETAALAARRADRPGLEELAEATVSVDQLDADGDSMFHRTLALVAGNPLMERASGDLLAHLHALREPELAGLYVQPHNAMVASQHEAVLDAVRRGDEEGARRAMRAHLSYVARALRRSIGALPEIRMVVSDIDGTLLSGPRLITARTKAAVSASREAGVVFVLASARPPRSMRAYHSALGLTTPVIAGNGALLWDLGTSIPLSRESLDLRLAREAVELGRALGAIPNIESDDEWFAERVTDRVIRNLSTYGVEPPHRVGPLDDILDGDDPVDKVFLDLRDLPQQARAEARDTILTALDERTNISESVDGLVDIVARRASKAVMAQRFARSRGLSADQVLAIGDHDNDIDLLSWAGVGVAMGNATPGAKAVADLVTSSSFRDGVAEAIERWVLPGTASA